MGKNNKNNEETKENDLVQDFLNQFNSNSSTEVILQDFDDIDVTEDVILNEKKKFKIGKITIFSFILFIALGLAFTIAFFLNNFKFVIGYNNIEDSYFSLSSVSVISSDYELDKNDLKVGQSILYGDNDSEFENNLKEATVEKVGDQVCTVSTENNNQLVLNYEKIAYILKDSK